MFGLQDRLLDEWQEPPRRERRRHLAAGRGSRLRRWSPGCSAARTPRSRRSPRPGPRRSRARARPAPARLLVIVEDPPRYLNTALFLRMLTEIAAIVLVTVVMLDLIVPRGGSESGPQTDGDRWWAMLASLAIMLVVSFVVIGVAPRTLGRQHSERVALLSAGPLIAFTKVLGPVPRLLILVGNAITPGRGFSEGPFASEAELRELVDLAEASSVIESGERQMIHSVFELGDTLVREVMVPRTDVVFIEQQQDPAPGHVPGAAQRLLPHPGRRREPRRRRRLRLPQGRHQAGLRPARGRDHRADRVGDAAGALRPRLQADRRAAARDAGRAQARRESSSTSTAAPPAWSPSRTCSRRSSGRSPTSTTWPGSTSSTSRDGSARVSSRYPVDDLEDISGVAVDDDDVDSVGGLMAKHLGRVPIAGLGRRGARAALRGRGARRAAATGSAPCW